MAPAAHEQTSPVRETAILFDWDSHQVFPSVAIAAGSSTLGLTTSRRATSPTFGSNANGSASDPMVSFRGPLAGASVYNPSLPPVHWYLEPAGQAYLPLTTRRAVDLVTEGFQPSSGARLTLVFPAALPSDTREVTLGLKGVHAVFVLRIRSSLATSASSAYEVLDLLLFSPTDQHLISIRIRVPTVAALAVKGTNLEVVARSQVKEVKEFERIASLAVMHGNRVFFAVPDQHFPRTITVWDNWEGVTSIPSTWKNDLDCLNESLSMDIIDSLRYLGNWFRPAPTHLQVLHIGKHTFVAALTTSGALRVLDARGVYAVMDAPLLPANLTADSNATQEPSRATSFHVLTTPDVDHALVAFRTNHGMFYTAKVVLASEPGAAKAATRIEAVVSLPSIDAALGVAETSASFVSAEWLSDSVLVAQYKNVGRSSGTHFFGINLATQPSPVWSRMPLASMHRTSYGSSAVHRALRAFCAEYHVHPTTAPGSSGSNLPDMTVFMKEVARSYTMMHPHVSVDAALKAIEEYVDRAVGLDTEAVSMVRVTVPVLEARQEADDDMDTGAQQEDSEMTPIESINSQARLSAGMLLVVKRAGFSLIRQSTAADAMVDALSTAIQHSDQYTHTVNGVTPTFADAWAIADVATLAAVARMQSPALTLDAAVRRGTDALLAQSFSVAISEWVNQLQDDVLSVVQDLEMRIVTDAGIKEVAHTITVALDALAVNAAPPSAGSTSAPASTAGLAVPHIVVPLLHDLLVDQQNLARAIVQVSLFIKAHLPDRTQVVSPKVVLDRVLDLFRMPDLLVSEAMPLLTLTQHAPMDVRVDQWAASQLASAMARAREWTPVERAKFVMSAPGPAVAALLDAQDPQRAPGSFLHALHRVVVEWQRGALDQAVTLVHKVVVALREASDAEREQHEPLIRTDWLLLGETAANTMLDRHMHGVSAKLFEELARMLVDEVRNQDLKRSDAAMHAQVQVKVAQLLGQAFSAYLQAGDMDRATDVLTDMSAMPQDIVPRSKVKNNVAHLVDKMAPVHVAKRPFRGLNALVVETLESKLAMLVQKANEEGPIGLTQRGLPVVVGMYEERAKVLEMLWRLFATDEESNPMEAAKYAYFQARALWAAACAMASRIGVALDDATGQYIVDWGQMQEVHQWAQLTLKALGEAHTQLMAVPLEGFRSVLVPQDEAMPYRGKKFVVSQDQMARQWDELSLACMLHKEHGDPGHLHAMAAAGLPTDTDPQDGGHLLRHDPSRLKELIVALKEAGDMKKASDTMAKYADDVRAETGMDFDWLYDSTGFGLVV